MPISGVRVLRDDFMFAEAPRWHDGRLYVSDFYAKEVVAVDLDGNRESVVTIPQQPSGLGWLPGGDMLIASMRDASVLRFDGTSLELVATVAPNSPVVNDMVVSPEGRAYVGGLPDLWSMLTDSPDAEVGEVQFPPEHLHLVEPGEPGEPGRTRIVASDLQMPNGAVITPDGRCLILVESIAMRLLAFDIEADGSLTGKRVWSELSGVNPDGICLDAEGCVWAAIVNPPGAYGFYRVAEGGEIKERFETDRPAVAVALGGPGGDDLFMAEATVMEMNRPEVHIRGNARVTVGKTDVPAAQA
jgi:sugar lactone lactonase YvrE